MRTRIARSRNEYELPRRRPPFERRVLLTHTLEWVRLADEDSELSADDEIEKLAQRRSQRRWFEQRQERKPRERLVLEDQPEQIRDAEGELLDVERAVDHDLAERGERLEASSRHGAPH